MSNCSSITLGYLRIRYAYFWIRAIYFPRSGSCWRINGHFSEKYSVSPLCQRVSPFKTLHALYLLGLCQRVNLFQKKLKIWIFFLRRVREIFRRPSSFFSIASQWIFCALGSKSKFLSNYLELSIIFPIFAATQVARKGEGVTTLW
jgi:hypothetical protein